MSQSKATPAWKKWTIAKLRQELSPYPVQIPARVKRKQIQDIYEKHLAEQSSHQREQTVEMAVQTESAPNMMSSDTQTNAPTPAPAPPSTSAPMSSDAQATNAAPIPTIAQMPTVAAPTQSSAPSLGVTPALVAPPAPAISAAPISDAVRITNAAPIPTAAPISVAAPIYSIAAPIQDSAPIFTPAPSGLVAPMPLTAPVQPAAPSPMQFSAPTNNATQPGSIPATAAGFAAYAAMHPSEAGAIIPEPPPSNNDDLVRKALEAMTDIAKTLSGNKSTSKGSKSFTLASAMKALEPAVHPAALLPIQPSASSSNGVPMSSLPHVELVSPELREDIIKVIAAKLWGSHWARKRIIFHSDNQAAVHALNKGRSSSQAIMKLIRSMVILATRYSFMYSAVYYEGFRNSIADAASRFQMERFRQLAPHADPNPTPLPDTSDLMNN